MSCLGLKNDTTDQLKAERLQFGLATGVASVEVGDSASTLGQNSHAVAFLKDVDYYSMESCFLKKATPLTMFVGSRWEVSKTLAKNTISFCLKISKNCLHCIEATINPKYHYTFNAHF
ncbi:hypothetical protein D917_10469 [Trichinella nativa]|uniref:Uncharacterized protein n=1 Tax=Trichinella nativa TaxID=6335 RepID=A0A1Y3EAN9_9BILA|nr:hypothetical protein D917_10469 [Trichinella nativa]